MNTVIKFSSSRHPIAEIFVVSLLGIEVARIFSGALDIGEHEFVWNANLQPPGLYVCVVRSQSISNDLVKELPI